MYQIAEKFKSIQGEGLYAGTPMAFIRFIGCSVGKKTCNFCDTDFEKAHDWRGGGEFTPLDLVTWVGSSYDHICLTGGEPLDQDLAPLFAQAYSGRMFHIETSGTVALAPAVLQQRIRNMWLCVSPKPGYLEEVVLQADEVKVIVPGLGSSSAGWPTLEDALRWQAKGKTVFLQPRNAKFDVDHINLKYVQDLLVDYPQFRLSVQMHKVLKVQ